MIDRKNLTIVRRIFGLEINPIHGKFDVEHLKAIHRTIFQNLPSGSEEFSPGEFRPPVGKNLDWIKKRELESVNAFSFVAYSSMSTDIQKRLEKVLSTIDVQKLSCLSRNDFCKYMADLYTTLDYIHPFKDGNSRTLRTFTEQIARESGYSLNWEKLDENPVTRDILYIARDISVNKIALPFIQNDSIKRDVIFSLDQLGNNRDMQVIMRDIVEPSQSKEKNQTQPAHNLKKNDEYER